MLNVPKALSLDAEGVESKILIKGGGGKGIFPTIRVTGGAS